MCKLASVAFFGLFLVGCSPAQLAQTQQDAYLLTVVDGTLYVRENHERRRLLRSKLYALQDAVIDECLDKAREASYSNAEKEALGYVNWCTQYIKDNYPSLVTVEALREGKAFVEEFGSGPAAPAPAPAGAN